MKFFFPSCLAAAIFISIASHSLASNENNDLLRLKAELLRTKKQLVVCQVAMANSQLSTEEAQVMRQFGCKNGKFNWDKLECEKDDEKK